MATAKHQRLRCDQSAIEMETTKLFQHISPENQLRSAGSERRRVTAVSGDSSQRSLDEVFLHYSNSGFGLGWQFD